MGSLFHHTSVGVYPYESYQILCALVAYTDTSPELPSYMHPTIMQVCLSVLYPTLVIFDYPKPLIQTMSGSFLDFSLQ
jgi:hypothetical protein